MTDAGGIKIGRLVIDGRPLTSDQARELAERIAAELGREFPEGARSLSLASLQVTPEGAGGLALPDLARSVAQALKRELA